MKLEVSFRKRNEVNNHFISRVGWDPSYSGGVTYWVDWCSEWNYGPETRGNRVMDIFGQVHDMPTDLPRFTGLGMEVQPYSILPVRLDDNTLKYVSAKAVSRYYFERGTFHFDVTVSNDMNVVEAMWFMAISRFRQGGHTYKPEFDAHELGVQENPVCDNVALHDRGSKMKQFHVEPGRHQFTARLDKWWYVSILDGKELCRYFRPRIIPMYPQFWTAVPEWADPNVKEFGKTIIHSFTWHE